MKKILKWVLFLFILFFLALNVPVIEWSHSESDIDYSDWMGDTLKDDTLIIDVAMLGAHDAYSSDITITSEVDPYETGIASTLPGKLIKGFLVKQSVTQVTDTQGFMKNGVRYLDIRLSYIDGEFYTKHGYVSSNFEAICMDLTDYLSNHPSEFLILDFQHIAGLDYENDEDYQVFLEMLMESNLIDYHYNSNLQELNEITYSDITTNQTKAGVIIIDKFSKEEKETYHYDLTVRSNWADDDNFDNVVTFLNDEADLISETTEYVKMFRVAQGVTTMQMNLQGIYNGITSWSLVERAQDFNPYLTEQEEFQNIIDHLPIIMVDYANSNSQNFVNDIMDIIIEKNRES